jgi:hypothetical protein
MRYGSWMKLATLGLLLVTLRGQALQAGPHKNRPPVVEDPFVTWDVDASYENTVDARDLALDQAKERILLFLSRQRPPLEWAGRTAYVDKQLREGNWVRGEQEVDVSSQEHQLKKMKLHIGLSAADYQAMVRLDREARAQDRQLLLVKGLGGSVLVLLILAGFFHVSAAKGSASRGMRVATVGLIVAVAAGCWFLA